MVMLAVVTNVKFREARGARRQIVRGAQFRDVEMWSRAYPEFKPCDCESTLAGDQGGFRSYPYQLGADSQFCDGRID